MRNTLLAVGAGLFACTAQAQMVEVDRVDPQALACLQKGGPALSYPAGDEKMRRPGHVRLSLRFTAPDRAPEIEVLSRASSDAMLDEVRWHVRGYRLPCMAVSAEPVLVVQEFEFRPRVTEPITWTTPRAVAGESAMDRAAIMACLRTPKQKPELTEGVLHREATNAFVELRFTAADAEPEVRMAYATVDTTQAREVTDYVRQYRLPCLPPGARPVTVRQHFEFRPAGSGLRVFKDAVPLTAFLSNMKGIRAMRANFDFNTMSCPFQIAWTLGKPALDNEIGQIGKPDLNRTEFLAWLAGLEMEVEERHFEQLVGQTVIVNVSCGHLTLEPQG